MSGGLFVSALLRETGRSLSKADIDRLQQAHAEQYRAQADSVTPLPGARELLGFLTDADVRWAIATSGYAATARLERAGAYRVYADPAEMLARIDELGVRTGNT